MIDLSIELAIGGFVLAALVIGVAGVRMTRLADALADRTGLGEAVVGGLLLGASTSLSGIVTSLTAAIDGSVSLAVSNAIGGIAVQTVFLVIADLAYRKVNLEHAAASEQHMLQTALLMVLLCLPLIAFLTPPYSIFGIHPVTPLIVAVYAFGVRASLSLRARPMWHPRSTPDTHEDVPDEDQAQEPLLRMLVQFGVLALILSAAGFVVARSGLQISQSFGVSQTVVGAVLTATATSLPELVTTLTAVRRGALQLAIAGIVGGNTFDVLFLTISDVAYRDGPLFNAMVDRDAVLITGALMITAVLLMGLIMRHKRGIGFEGVAILAIYAGMVALQLQLD